MYVSRGYIHVDIIRISEKVVNENFKHPEKPTSPLLPPPLLPVTSMRDALATVSCLLVTSPFCIFHNIVVNNPETIRVRTDPQCLHRGDLIKRQNFDLNWDEVFRFE